MPRRLPPLNSLKAFEAAARNLSFTKAADELFVTQAAISHQIKTLEDGSGRFHPDEAGDPSEKERNAADLISDGGCLFFKPVPWFF